MSGRLVLLILPGLLMLLLSAEAQVLRKSVVGFYSGDSLLITADHYFSHPDNPYILLFHQEGSSRGEFDSIAERFVKMQYNCIAADIRGGERYGFVGNETTRRAREEGFSYSPERAGMDIEATIAYAVGLSNKPLILLGSSFSASLCLKASVHDERVAAVMAFSPGEFFGPGEALKTLLQDFQKKVFVAYTRDEAPYIEEMFSPVGSGYKTLFTPRQNEGMRGVKALKRDNPSFDEYWFGILVFIKNLQS
jgi:hypothetical protein